GHGAAAQKRTFGEAAAIVAAGIGVLADGRSECQPHALPVFGDVAHADAAPLGNAQAGDVAPAQDNPPGACRLQARQSLNQLGLAVAADAGYADDLAGADGKAERADGPAAPADAQSLDGENGLAGRARRALAQWRQLAADDAARDLLLGGLGERRRGHQPAASHHRDAV